MKLTASIHIERGYGDQLINASGAEELIGVEFADEDDGQAIFAALDTLVAHVKERALWQISRKRQIAALALKAKRAEEASAA